MKPPSHPFLLAPLALAMVLSLAAQDAAPRAPEPVRPPPAAGTNEVQKSKPVGDQDARVLHDLHTMPVERLQELLDVYEKLHNTAMMDAVARSILKQDPKNAEALHVRHDTSKDNDERPRDTAYLDALSQKVLAGQPVDDPDGVGIRAAALIEQQHPAEAVKLLEALRRNQFKDKPFPFLDDLAYGYSETGRSDLAQAAYQAVLADASADPQSREEARHALDELGLKARIETVRRSGDLQAAARLHAQQPDNDDVTTFYLEALERAHRWDEEIALLLPMRHAWHGPGAWPYLSTLASAYYGARHYDLAVRTFREIQKAPDTDAPSRRDAEDMILEIQVGRLVERGTAELEKGQYAAARTTLAELERNYPGQDDVIGFKAMVLTKTGRSDEALALLFARKRDAQNENRLFTQQDVIADVYVERKDFDAARAATHVIIDDPRYDSDSRGEAMKKLREIDVADLLQQGYHAIEDAHRAHALALQQKLQALAPDDIDVRIFEVEVALAYNRSAFARDQLLQLKQTFPADKPFPGQVTLASALAKTGRWEEARNAYAEVSGNPGYEPEDQWDALKEVRDLGPWFMPTFRTDNHYEQSSEGHVFSTSNQYSTAWINDWRFTGFFHTDFTQLNRANLFSDRRDVRSEAGLTAMRRFDNGYFAEATTGASDQHDVLYGARIGKLSYEGLGWELGYTGNARATDSIPLQAVNGRENRASFKVSGPLTERVQIDLDAYYQWIKAGGGGIGTGQGLEASVDYVLQTETKDRPEILLGYHGAYHHFDPTSSIPRGLRDEIRRAEVPQNEVRRALGSDEEVRRAIAGNFGNEVFNTLIDRDTDRHGAELKIRKHFSHHWAVAADIGGYYAFEAGAPGYNAGISLEYWINDHANVFGELRYDSEGRGSATGAGVWELELGGSISF